MSDAPTSTGTSKVGYPLLLRLSVNALPTAARLEISQLLFELSTDAVIAVDTRGVVLAWNHAAQLLLGPPAGEAVGRPLQEGLSGETMSVLMPLLRGATSLITSVRLPGRRGRRPVVDVRGSHQQWGVLILMRDRTEQVESQVVLSEVHTRQRQLEHLADVGLWQLDRITGDMQLSEQMFVIFGLDPLRAVGTFDELVDLVQPDTRSDFRAAIEAVEEAGDVVVDVPIVRHDGSQRWVHVRASALAETPHVISGIAQDVTAMRDALEAAERANHELLRFAGVVAHDLRSPLGMVAGLAELLRSPRLPDDRRTDIIERIENNARRASEQVDTLLQEAQRRTSRLAPVDLEDVARWVKGFVATSLEDAGVELVWDALPSVQGRHALVRQCVLNLVTNAIKYGRAGGQIEIRARRVDGAHEVAVHDGGSGVPQDARDFIFEEGTRLDEHAAVDGNGIGLSAVRAAMTRMEGSVRVESSPLGGAAFVLRFPDGQPAAEPQRLRAPTHLPTPSGKSSTPRSF